MELEIDDGEDELEIVGEDELEFEAVTTGAE